MQHSTEFYEELERWRNVSFSWPEANCCHFTAAMLRAQGYEVPYEVPSVADAVAARAWLQERGFKSLYALLRGSLGNPITPLQASRGDLAYCKKARVMGTIGVVDHDLVFFVGDKGLEMLSRRETTRAFRVGSLPRG